MYQPTAIEPANPFARGWTPERKALFLDHLARKGNVRAACAVVGLSAEAAYRLRRRDPLFARGWAAALLLARDSSVHVLADRAIEGVEEPIYYRGELVGTRRRYDTRLLLAHLARLDKLTDEEGAGEDAARFDELLAVVAGEPAPQPLPGEDPLLPPDREAYAQEAARLAEEAVRLADCEEPDEEASDGEGELLPDGDPDPFEDWRDQHDREEDEYQALLEQCAAAAERAIPPAYAEWDGWFARACRRVDALDEANPTAAADGSFLRTPSTASTCCPPQERPAEA